MTQKPIHSGTLDSVWFISVALTTFRSPNDTLQQHNDHQNSHILGRRYVPLLKSCEQFLFIHIIITMSVGVLYDESNNFIRVKQFI